MKIDFIKRLFSKKKNDRTYSGVRYVQALSQVPQDTGNDIYIVGSGGSYKWAVFKCPNSCGKRVEVNLMQSRYPRWQLKVRRNHVSLYPSVVVTDCGAHFWLENNDVEWARFKDI